MPRSLALLVTLELLPGAENEGEVSKLFAQMAAIAPKFSRFEGPGFAVVVSLVDQSSPAGDDLPAASGVPN